MEQYLLLALFLLVSGFFSCSETALFSLSKHRVKRLSKEKGWRGETVADLLHDPTQLLITILLGNMFVNVASSALAERMATAIWGPSGLGWSVLIMTFLLLVVGEITPKTIAVMMSENIALFVAPVIHGFARLITPLRLVIRYASGIMIAWFSPAEPPRKELNDEELQTAISIGEEAGQLRDKEKRLMENVLALARKNVRRIMVPWPEVFALDIAKPLDSLRLQIREYRFSRIPIYEGSKENILGILLLKDCLPWLRTGRDFDLRRHLIKADYIPEAMPLQTVLSKFRQGHSHLSLVVDEYGDISGIVTLQDVLDELLAGLCPAQPPDGALESLPDGGWRVRAGVHVDDLKHWTGVDLSGYQAQTIGGVVARLLDRIPVKDDQAQAGSYVLKVEKASTRRAESIIIVPQACSQEAPSQEAPSQEPSS